MVSEEDLTLGSECTMQHIDDVHRMYTWNAYILLNLI